MLEMAEKYFGKSISFRIKLFREGFFRNNKEYGLLGENIWLFREHYGTGGTIEIYSGRKSLRQGQ